MGAQASRTGTIHSFNTNGNPSCKGDKKTCKHSTVISIQVNSFLNEMP
jgi:hypothetical protein